jgi:hypothetical protein
MVGALCGAIVVAAGAGTWVWWRSTQVDDWVPVEDLQTYDMCLAAGKTTVACDAWMRVLARGKAIVAAEQDAAIKEWKAVIKQEVEKKLAGGATKCDVAKWARDAGVYAQVSAVLGIPVKQLDSEC